MPDGRRPPLAEALARAGLRGGDVVVRRVRWAAAGLPGLATALAGPAAGIVLAVVAAGLTVAPGPQLALTLLDRRDAARRDADLPAALEVAAAALRSGAALPTAVRDAAAAATGPLAAELAEVVATVDSGTPLGEAVEAWRVRAGSPVVDLATAALVLAAEAGGPVARALDAVAGSLRERRETAAEAASLATQAKASAAVLAVAPLAFAGLTAMADPEAASFLVGSAAGAACLAGGTALLGLGAAWMARIVRAAT
ncbi:MAG: type II secretion system F family protein [Acidimicrobiia bacterium]